MAWRVGVDVGGTFTDLAAVEDASGAVRLEKVPTTPADQSIGVATGLSTLLARHGVSPATVTYLGHGTTVCINAVLEKKGARTGLVTTQGMRDLLELRRQIRDDLYDLQADKPAPLVPRDWRREVPERTLADGGVATALDIDAVRAAIGALVAEGVEALAVCFLHSYVNPAHERQVAELARREFPELYLSVSSDVLPEFREFERLSTTVMNAYVGPVMGRYLRRFEERVAALGLGARPLILQSNGGVATVDQVRERPVYTMASGPTAGVTGAAYLASRAGHPRIITFDMGGTSTDVSVVEQGTPVTAAEKSYHGYPVKAAMLDVDSIGAGGGSLAWIDPGGFLRVGPRSAGADPGPAAYARGGESPTVTDANLALGRLDPDYFLGGAMRLDRDRAFQAIDRDVARPLGLSITDAALGIVKVVDANMAAAIRLATVERGRDPRHFTLVAFGGAGPMHAAAVARLLGIPRVLVPPSPGVLCALGLLVADVRTELSRTALLSTDRTTPAELNAIFGDLERRAGEWAHRGGLPAEDLSLARSIEMRYARQNHELVVQVGRRATPAELARRFHQAHRRAFGYASPEEATELVTFRVTAMFPVARPTIGGSFEEGDPSRGTRAVYFESTKGFVETPVLERRRLAASQWIAGPAVIEQIDCTTVVEPGQTVAVDADGNLVITVGGA
ncbi:MAG TPA: hydantoinase/oxoprolinase family protein [Candidatus Methylomirabilis sp.]|nr:hydantoinase/oxoprolinase family protein [Candidatus Methylomirabilis sp.]